MINILCALEKDMWYSTIVVNEARFVYCVTGISYTLIDFFLFDQLLREVFLNPPIMTVNLLFVLLAGQSWLYTYFYHILGMPEKINPYL